MRLLKGPVTAGIISELIVRRSLRLPYRDHI